MIRYHPERSHRIHCIHHSVEKVIVRSRGYIMLTNNPKKPANLRQMVQENQVPASASLIGPWGECPRAGGKGQPRSKPHCQHRNRTQRSVAMAVQVLQDIPWVPQVVWERVACGVAPAVVPEPRSLLHFQPDSALPTSSALSNQTRTQKSPHG